MKKEYRVIWTIDIDANSPREAAQIAREIQQDRESFATFFHVREKEAQDLSDSEELEAYEPVDLEDSENG